MKCSTLASPERKAKMCDTGPQPRTSDRYRIVVRNGWSYVVGEPTPRDSGPWRYQWEAQEHADKLNGRVIAA